MTDPRVMAPPLAMRNLHCSELLRVSVGSILVLHPAGNGDGFRTRGPRKANFADYFKVFEMVPTRPVGRRCVRTRAACSACP